MHTNVRVAYTVNNTSENNTSMKKQYLDKYHRSGIQSGPKVCDQFYNSYKKDKLPGKV